MDKCREAFEKQKHLTIYISNLVFDEKDNRYIPNEKRIRTFEEWEWKAFSNQAYAVNLAWWAWQSRQAEFDAMTEALLNQTHLLAKQKVEVDEKDKRIERALLKWSSLASILTTTDMIIVPDDVFVKLDELGEALRGEHE